MIKNRTAEGIEVINEGPGLTQRGANRNGIRIRKQKQARVPLQMAKTTIDRIIYPVQTKRGLKYPKKKMIPGLDGAGAGFVPRDVMADAQAIQSKSGKLLDGFLILYSCRVKLPHEAIKSKLDGQNIMQVIEEDLCYFQNLSAIDLADNHVRLEQLKNLKSLVEINL